MSLFRRLFSADYRRAVSAEAEGDYLEAAKSYALCGEPAKVARMHLAQAGVAPELDQRIHSLNTALGFAPAGSAVRHEVLDQLGRALREQAREAGVSTTRGQRLLREAATRFTEGGHHERSGDCWLELEDREQAAAAYSRAGLVEKVEQLLSAQEEQQDRRRREEDCFKDHELMLQGGQRDQAVEALRACIEVARHKGEYRRLLEGLEQRLLHEDRVTLQLGDEQITLRGSLPLVIGREAGCPLQVRGQSVSRRHARIVEGTDGQLLLEDLGSHNGTLLGGLPLGAPVPLPPSAVVGLGDSCTVEARVQGGGPELQLHLRVARGLDAGKRLVVSAAPLDLGALLDDGPPLLVWFERGRPLARPRTGTLLLNGARTGGPVQLIVDDRIELDRHRLQVVG